MHVVEINGVDPETRQARLDGLADMLRRALKLLAELWVLGGDTDWAGIQIYTGRSA